MDDSEYQCAKCGVKYPKKHNLIQHIVAKHGLKCSMCDEKLSTMGDLKIHFTNIHGLENAYQYGNSNVFKLVQMCSNVLKCVQTCSELVQMCSFHIRSNLFKTFSNVMYQGYNSILL